MIKENSPIKRSPCLEWDLGVVSQHTARFFKSLSIFRKGGEVVVSLGGLSLGPQKPEEKARKWQK